MQFNGQALRGPIIAIAFTLLAACGTTSGLQSDAGQPAAVDLTPYNRLIVEDFKDEATGRAKPEAQPLLKPKLDNAVKIFPDQIASVVKSAGGFESVERSGTPAAGTLVLRGIITQYDEGNAAMRWLVGFAAGNTNFDSTLQLVDGADGRTLGTWTVDKNSWALGGGIAATQTPESFMQEAAKKIGEELSAKRKAGSIVPPK
jgi:Domain of unknown function (DUF4410)